MTNTGKIARLPKPIRDQLNQRLDDGQAAEDILPWLNHLPECKKVLAEKFDSRPITRQNLSQWKTAGYQTWLRVQQAREQVQSLVEQAKDLGNDEDGLIAKDGMTLADRLGSLLVVQLLTALQQLDNIADPDQRWQRIKDISRELSRLRREDHHGRRVHLAGEQWDNKRTRQEEQDAKDRKEAESGRLIAWACSLFTTKDRIESCGGGEMGRRWADWFHRVENDLPLPKWWPGPWADTDFGPDGANWSNVSFPNGSKGSSSNGIKAPPSQKSAGLPTRRDSNKANSQTSDRSEKSDPSPVTHHPPASPTLPSEAGSLSTSGPGKVNQSKSKQHRSDVTPAANPSAPQSADLPTGPSQNKPSPPPSSPLAVHRPPDEPVPKSNSSDLSDPADSPPPAFNPPPPSTL